MHPDTHQTTERTTSRRPCRPPRRPTPHAASGCPRRRRIACGPHPLLALLALVLGAVAPAAHAIPLEPGDRVGLPGGSLPGTVVRDALVPFTIIDQFGLRLSGTVQDRVLRRPDGTLAFVPRIRDVSGPSGLGISRVLREGFAGFTTDVNYSSSGLGTAAPTSCARSGDGDNLDYSFSFSPVFRGQESRFFWADTDADQFDSSGGQMTLILEDGRSATITVAAPIIDTTPPEVRITGPAPESCVCPSLFTTIRAVVCDQQSDLSWTLRARRSRDADGTGWTTIATGTGEFCAPVNLANWDTRSLSGEHILELEAINEVGLVATAAIEVRIDAGVSPASLRTPADGVILGGTTCFDGTVAQDCGGEYTVGFRPAGSGGGFTPVDPDNPLYTGSVVNDPFAFWNTAGLADGDYDVRIRTTNPCGQSADLNLRYEIDNTAPIARIGNIEPCQWVSGMVEVRGQIADANLSIWVLEYTGAGERRWRTIATGTGGVTPGGLIAVWDTTGLERCAYTLRLRAIDSARVGCVAPGGNAASDLVSFNVGCEADLNADGVLNIFDFLAFQNLFDAGCP